jgi:hypothetical protein
MNPKFRDLDFDPRNIPADYLQAIGLASACYAQTEDNVQWAIAGLLGIDMETGWAISTHMSAPLRESVLKSLSELKMTNLGDLEKLDKLLEDVKTAGGKRNDIAHNLWCRDEKTGEVFHVLTEARNRVSVKQKPVSLKSIQDDANFIYSAGIELLRFLLAKNLVPALPPRDRIRFDKRKAIKDKKPK